MANIESTRYYVRKEEDNMFVVIDSKTGEVFSEHYTQVEAQKFADNMNEV